MFAYAPSVRDMSVECRVRWGNTLSSHLTIAAVADNSVTFPALLMPTDPDGSGL